MNLEELQESLEDILPEGFQITLDARGQVIIKTGLVEDESGELHADGGADIDSDELDLLNLDEDEDDENPLAEMDEDDF